MPVYLQIILGVMTPIIACTSVYIAYQQYKLGKYKLKHDLYDRRWKVYAATNDAIVTSINGSVTDATDAYAEFKRKKVDAKFLFPNKVNAYLDEVDKSIQELRIALRKLTAHEMKSDSQERADLEQEINVISDWLRQQVEEIVNTFNEYLNLTI